MADGREARDRAGVKQREQERERHCNLNLHWECFFMFNMEIVGLNDKMTVQMHRE